MGGYFTCFYPALPKPVADKVALGIVSDCADPCSKEQVCLASPLLFPESDCIGYVNISPEAQRQSDNKSNTCGPQEVDPS